MSDELTKDDFCSRCGALLSTVYACTCSYREDRALRLRRALGASFTKSNLTPEEAARLYAERQAEIRAAGACRRCGA